MSIVTALGIQHVHSPCLWENGRRKLTLVAYLICSQCCISRLWEAFGMFGMLNQMRRNWMDSREGWSVSPAISRCFCCQTFKDLAALPAGGRNEEELPAELDSYDHSWASQQEPLELLPFPEVGSLQALEAVNPCLPTCVFFFPHQTWYWGNNQKDPNSTATAK